MSSELLNVIHEARQSSTWAIVLVPKVAYREAPMSLSALCDAELSGRTIRWPDRPGKITVAYAEQENPVPKDVPFDLYLAAWQASEEGDRKCVKPWLATAQRLVSSNTHHWDVDPIQIGPASGASVIDDGGQGV